MSDNSWIQATRVVNTALGVLMREVVLPNLLWRDALSPADFKGVVGDTVTIRVPAYVTARKRTLRTREKLTMDKVAETSVDVKLDTDIYKGVSITDEDMTLDIRDFTTQILMPILSAVRESIEDECADTLSGATYTLEGEFSESDPLHSVLTADRMLTDCRVPQSNRYLACGSQIKQIIVESLANRQSGNDNEQSALEDATIARGYGGFRNVVVVPGLAPNECYAFHKTAFPFVNTAPLVPGGAAWGETRVFDGYAMRVIKDYDADYTEDRCIASSWIGTGVTLDNGELNDDGQFVPYETEDEIGSGTPILVRAVKLTLGS